VSGPGPLALVFLVGYNYTKRFTWTSHWILGFTDGIAAAGAGSPCAAGSTRRYSSCGSR